MITIVKRPQKFTPADSPIIFQILSNNTNVVYFNVQVKEAVSNSVISELEIYATPSYPNGSYVDLSKILSNAVKWEVNNSTNLLTVPISRSLLKYKISFTERGVVDGAIVNLSPTLNLTDVFFTWNANIDRFRFYSFIYSDYAIRNGLPIKFLTYKPNSVVVNDFSSEQLAFLHEAETTINVVVKTYDVSDTLLNTYTDSVGGLLNDNIFRIQVSPKSLVETFGADFTDVSYYTMQLTNAANDVKSEVRKYIYQSVPCHVRVQNIFWINSLGGVDTYQMVNVTETNNISRNTIKKNPYQIFDGFYTDRKNDIINPSEEVIDVTQQGTYTANTQFLNDEECQWLNELFISKQVFIELADASLVPVIITNTSYQIQKQYLNKTSYNTVQVTYQLSGELIPNEASAYSSTFGNGSIQLDFIDSQFNG